MRIVLVILTCMAILLLASTAWADVYTFDDDEIEDTYVKYGNANDNYGTAGNMLIQNYGGDDSWVQPIVRAKDILGTIGAGATITQVVCSLNVYSHTDNKTVEAFRLFKPWVEIDTGSSEGGATYNDWSSPDDEWGTEGIKCEKDAGADNSVDNAACNNARADRTETALDSQSITGNGWYVWDITSLGQAWYAQTANENGVVFVATSSDGNGGSYFYSRDSESAFEPRFVFTYTVAGATAAQVITIRSH